jgi:hypothetical protein
MKSHIPDTVVKAAAERWIADPRLTLAAVGKEIGLSKSQVCARFFALGYRAERKPRGKIHDARTARDRAEAERKAALVAERAAKNLTRHGDKRADITRALWLRYPAESAQVLATEVGWATTGLINAWKGLGYDPLAVMRAKMRQDALARHAAAGTKLRVRK